MADPSVSNRFRKLNAALNLTSYTALATVGTLAVAATLPFSGPIFLIGAAASTAALGFFDTYRAVSRIGNNNIPPVQRSPMATVNTISTGFSGLAFGALAVFGALTLGAMLPFGAIIAPVAAAVTGVAATVITANRVYNTLPEDTKNNNPIARGIKRLLRMFRIIPPEPIPKTDPYKVDPESDKKNNIGASLESTLKNPTTPSRLGIAKSRSPERTIAPLTNLTKLKSNEKRTNFTHNI